MLVVFPPIFVANTKIIYGYNFVTPLIGLFIINDIWINLRIYGNGECNVGFLLLKTIISSVTSLFLYEVCLGGK